MCLSDFLIGRHEVTVGEYKQCVTAGGCLDPINMGSATRTHYYDDATNTFDGFPVIWVSWDQADDYCAWVNGFLPTEAEWEYAARGGLAGARYPWGSSISGGNANYLNSGDIWDNDTSLTENYASNGYGLYDVAGNVWEWVYDWYDPLYYSTRPNPDNDPLGPGSGTMRVVRGGAWNDPTTSLRVSLRNRTTQSSHSNTIGFRCAKSPSSP